ncbi:hypothetical protein PFISCL1PPCAC_16827, partial [Pristionchus fissidentatus]
KMSFKPVATTSDVEKGAKAPESNSVFLHRHTCTHCGNSCEKEIAVEQLHHFLLPYHPPRSAWHAVHSQTIHYTINVFLVALVILLTLIAAKFVYGK